MPARLELDRTGLGFVTMRGGVHPATASPRHLWVAPPFDGPPTGGTIYNAALCAALSRCGVACDRVSVDQATRAVSSGGFDCCWVDTLYLDAFPQLARANVANAPLRLVVHYLPSLAEQRESLAALRPEERAALDEAHGCLATSSYMAGVLEELGVPGDRIAVVEPGVSIDSTGESARATARELRVIVVANLSPSKGVHGLLASLAARSAGPLPFRMSMLGSLRMDESYARSCRALVDANEHLAGRVDFLGPVEHDEVIALMHQSDVFVSSSMMESYGMALAEARAVGLPIVALRGGNTENHVDARAGGALFEDLDGLAADLLRLGTEPQELRRRTQLARSGRRARTWDEAAKDFVQAFKPPREPWRSWTVAHSIAMLVLILAGSWAKKTLVPAAGGAVSVLVLVALEWRRWTEQGSFGWANVVTLARLGLVVALAAMPGGPTAALVVVGILGLDAVDGWVARTQRQESTFGAKFDMETDALLIAVAGVKVFEASGLGAWILVPGLLRYLYAISIGLFRTRGEAPRSRFGRYVFAVQVTSLVTALWPIEAIFRPFAAVATLLIIVSFARSAYWSLGARRVHSDQRQALVQ